MKNRERKIIYTKLICQPKLSTLPPTKNNHYRINPKPLKQSKCMKKNKQSLKSSEIGVQTYSKVLLYLKHHLCFLPFSLQKHHCLFLAITLKREPKYKSKEFWISSLSEKQKYSLKVMNKNEAKTTHEILSFLLMKSCPFYSLLPASLRPRHIEGKDN